MSLFCLANAEKSKRNRSHGNRRLFSKRKFKNKGMANRVKAAAHNEIQ